MAQALLKTAPTYQRLTVAPLTGALGAEIGGVDLAKPIDAATHAEILAAFHEHQVIYFPDQKLSHEQHLAFCRLFGDTIIRLPQVHCLDECPDLQIVRREATETDTYVVGENWHADSTFLDRPPLGIVMRAIEVPDHGGDTAFASMYRAYEALSPRMQALLGGLKAVHSGTWVFGSASKKRYSNPDVDLAVGDREIVHPVVRTHPATGRKSLFINKVYVRRFEGMTEDESRPILQFLYDHIARPEFGCRVRWRNDQILIWDNRCTMHRAIADSRVADRTAFMLDGKLVEVGPTQEIFTNPTDPRTEEYVTGKFG